MPEPPFSLVFYAEASGREPVREWIKNDLTAYQRSSVGVAMSDILQHEGISVCESEWGGALGRGLYEFRQRRNAAEVLGDEARTPAKGERLLLRVFFHPYGDQKVLLLGGYDKLRDPSDRRQRQEIELARQRLADWRQRKPDAR